MLNRNYKQSGAVSLFVVVFAALLITIVTVSFVRIMLQDQEEATTTDLSQSAYDSAQAGIEDSKRALLRYQSICNNNPNSQECIDAKTAINSKECNIAVKTLNDVSEVNNEIKVKTGTNSTLDQAYTCTKITLNTPDYKGVLRVDESNIIPLKGISDFDIVQIDWFNAKDLSSGIGGPVALQYQGSYPWPLFRQTGWSVDTPSIIRAQMIQFGSTFTLNDFEDDDNANNISNSNTVFLYPSGTKNVALNSASSAYNKQDIYNKDNRKSSVAAGRPTNIICSGVIDSSTNSYACNAQLVLPTPVIHVAGDANRTLFLRLSSIYNDTSYTVTLKNSKILDDDGKPVIVSFSAVQPEIDSNGRANSLFRRVKVRVELSDINFPYPDAAIDITGDLCKDFSVTDDTSDYNDDYSDASVGECVPEVNN